MKSLTLFGKIRSFTFKAHQPKYIIGPSSMESEDQHSSKLQGLPFRSGENIIDTNKSVNYEWKIESEFF